MKWLVLGDATSLGKLLPTHRLIKTHPHSGVAELAGARPPPQSSNVLKLPLRLPGSEPLVRQRVITSPDFSRFDPDWIELVPIASRNEQAQESLRKDDTQAQDALCPLAG